MSKDYAKKLYPRQYKAKHLIISQLKRLDNEISKYGDIENESLRTKEMSNIAQKIIAANNLVMEAQRVSEEMLIGNKILPECLEMPNEFGK